MYAFIHNCKCMEVLVCLYCFYHFCVIVFSGWNCICCKALPRVIGQVKVELGGGTAPKLSNWQHFYFVCVVGGCCSFWRQASPLAEPLCLYLYWAQSFKSWSLRNVHVTLHVLFKKIHKKNLISIFSVLLFQKHSILHWRFLCWIMPDTYRSARDGTFHTVQMFCALVW